MTQLSSTHIEFFLNKFKLNPDTAFEMLQFILKQRPFNVEVKDDLRAGGEGSYKCPVIGSTLTFMVLVDEGKMPMLGIFLPDRELLVRVLLSTSHMKFEVPGVHSHGSLNKQTAELFYRLIVDRTWIFAETLVEQR